jgi:hypothetical protein
VSPRYRDEATEIAHLEGSEFPGCGTVGGATVRDRAPHHTWVETPWNGERCARCDLRRFTTQSRRWGDGWLYQRPNGQTRMGAEPACMRRGGS